MSFFSLSREKANEEALQGIEMHGVLLVHFAGGFFIL
jgi:hypothetical protein